MDEQGAVASLAALAQDARLRIFRALVGAGPAGMTPGALSALLGVPPSTLSFHLKELALSALVTQQRDGRHLIYRASFDRFNDLLAYLTAHCCLDRDAPACVVVGSIDCRPPSTGIASPCAPERPALPTGSFTAWPSTANGARSGS